MRVLRVARATRVLARADTFTFFRRGIGDTSGKYTNIHMCKIRIKDETIEAVSSSIMSTRAAQRVLSSPYDYYKTMWN